MTIGNLWWRLDGAKEACSLHYSGAHVRLGSAVGARRLYEAVCELWVFVHQMHDIEVRLQGGQPSGLWRSFMQKGHGAWRSS